MSGRRTSQRGGRHLLVVGAGGNIGSHLVPHLARLPEVSRLTLIDQDRYDAGNITGQNVMTRELGKAKARVIAARAAAIRPDLEVTAVVAPVESLPLGRLRADVLLTGLDSRRSRQVVSLAALRLGVPWIDAGVKGDDWLARATCYRPGPGEACLECAWDERDYRNLQEEFPCAGAGASPHRTGAASFVGALAASLQAALCQTHLDGHFEAGFQVLVDARHHKHHVTRFVRNHRCRVDPHGPLAIRPVRAKANGLTLGEAFSLARYRLETSRLQVEGKAFARALTCRECSVRRETLRLIDSRGASGRTRCRRCRGEMETAGLDVAESVSLSELSSRFLGSRLARLGFRDGEVFTVTGNGGEKHFELAGGDKP